MDPHLLRTFVAVARLGSFSRAAAELGYTQSAISQHIATLEHQVGSALLHRRPVGPTEVGARLLEHAGPILLRIDGAEADLARLRTAPTARIILGASPLALRPRWSRLLADARDARPELEVTVRVRHREAVRADLATGAIDLAVVDGLCAAGDPLHLPEAGGLTAIGIGEEPIVVPLPPDHPLAGRAGLRLSDLAEARWVDAPGVTVPLAELRTVIESTGYRAGMCYDGTDVRGLVMLVSAGHGLTVLPLSAVEGQPALVAVAVSAPRLVYRVELVHSTSLAGPAGDLASALVKQAAPVPS